MTESGRVDLLAAIEDLAFAGSDAPCSVNARPRRESAVVAPVTATARRAELLDKGGGAPIFKKPEAEIEAELLALLGSSGGPGPTSWKQQLRMILDCGTRGTVEDFHTFLIGLASPERAEPEPEFVALCAAVLSAQTRDAVVLAAVRRLGLSLGARGCRAGADNGGCSNSTVGLTAAVVANADVELLEECVHGVNFNKTKARGLRAMAAALLNDHGGLVPQDFESLIRLPGVGPKVANMVRSVAFVGEIGEVGMVVDTHVHRLARRLGWTGPQEKSPEQTRRKLELFLPHRVREMIARRLISFGQNVCLSRGPRCQKCPLAGAHMCPSAPDARTSGVCDLEPEAVEPQAHEPISAPQRRFAELAAPHSQGTKRRIELD